MFDLPPPRHISTLRNGVDPGAQPRARFLAYTGHC